MWKEKNEKIKFLVFLFKLDEFLRKSDNLRMRVALLLDYDGTLSPIAPRPEMATLPEETRDGKSSHVHLDVLSTSDGLKVPDSTNFFCMLRLVLERLSRRREEFFVAIISGRAVSNVKEMASVEVRFALE